MDYAEIATKRGRKVLGGFEPPSLDSESRVLTVTPQDHNGSSRISHRNRRRNLRTQTLDLSGFEPEAFCMQSRCDTTTPQARLIALASSTMDPHISPKPNKKVPDSSGVRTHALSDQRLKLAP